MYDIVGYAGSGYALCTNCVNENDIQEMSPIFETEECDRDITCGNCLEVIQEQNIFYSPEKLLYGKQCRNWQAFIAEHTGIVVQDGQCSDAYCIGCFLENFPRLHDEFIHMVGSEQSVIGFGSNDVKIVALVTENTTKEALHLNEDDDVLCYTCDTPLIEEEEEEEANSDNDIVGYMILGNHPNVQLDDQDCYVTCVQCAEDGDEIGSDYITREQAREENEHCDNCGMELSKVRIS